MAGASIDMHRVVSSYVKSTSRVRSFRERAEVRALLASLAPTCIRPMRSVSLERHAAPLFITLLSQNHVGRTAFTAFLKALDALKMRGDANSLAHIVRAVRG